jgi:hypothetical protein
VPQVKYNFKGIGELGELQKDEMTGMLSRSGRKQAELTERCHRGCTRSHGVGIGNFQSDTEASKLSQSAHTLRNMLIFSSPSEIFNLLIDLARVSG